MADYIDETGLRERFGAVEIDDLAESDANAVARACTDATQMIDGYLAAGYTLPLSSVPPMVTAWAADIARYRLWDEQAPEEVRRRFEDALAQLKLLATGTIALPPGADGAAVSPPVNFGGYSAARVFTACSLKDF
ncbi:MAG: gp436 family protein [Steroidobacteraceae bacterium]